MVITDVHDSTALWEWNKDIMTEAAQMNEDCLRDNMTRFHGYESSAEGDSMSLVFKDALEAMQFCLSAQTDLLLQQWPDDLLEHPSAPQEGKVYKGLRVTMATHVGNGSKKMNQSTNRLNYEGPVADECAAILKAVDGGGVVVVSMSVLGDLQGKFSHKISELGQFTIQDIGTYLLPACEEPIGLIQMMPQDLNLRPYTTLSGCVKLSCAYGEAPGVKVKGADVAFVFCSMKIGGGDKGATAMMKDMKDADKKPRRSSVAAAPKNVIKNEEYMAELLRTTAFANNGYVTKTSNGVSLLAFHSASEGCRFIRDICATLKSGDQGISFSAGLHVGKPSSAFPNKGSGRCDYLGPPVNTSARVMALTAEKPEFKKGGPCAGASRQVLDEGCQRAYGVLRTRHVECFPVLVEFCHPFHRESRCLQHSF